MSTLYPKKNREDCLYHFTRHMDAMEKAPFFRKCDIAIQLAWRDAEIEYLRRELKHYERPAECEGMTEWRGHAMTLPPDTPVVVLLNCGRVVEGRAADFDWGFPLDHMRDIRAYRVVGEAATEAPKPDADGWITWNGGECPVPADTKVEVRLRNGRRILYKARYFRWGHDDVPFDIIAYRVIEGGEAPKPDADGWITWNGGACPVPADTEVEIRLRHGFRNAGRACCFVWVHKKISDDIVAYRVIEQKDNG